MRPLWTAAFALFCLDAALCRAQSPTQTPVVPCGLTSVTPGTELIYPPIAKAAHVSGTVVVLSTFDENGRMVGEKIVSGPEMLRFSTLEYLKHLRANEFTGPRECAIAVTFRITGTPHECRDNEQSLPSRTIIADPQHISIESPSSCFVTMY